MKTLSTTTNSLKSSLEQKSCQLLNKTNAVYEKIKLSSETSSYQIESSCKENTSNSIETRDNKTIQDANNSQNHEIMASSKHSSEGSNSAKQSRRQGPSPNQQTIDLTVDNQDYTFTEVKRTKKNQTANHDNWQFIIKEH